MTDVSLDYSKLAKIVWPEYGWISGNGRYALLAYCGTLTISLWSTYEDAMDAKQVIDLNGCGNACPEGSHEVVDLDFYWVRIKKIGVPL
jgi:hypothetical protein